MKKGGAISLSLVAARARVSLLAQLTKQDVYFVPLKGDVSSHIGASRRRKRVRESSDKRATHLNGILTGYIRALLFGQR